MLQLIRLAASVLICVCILPSRILFVDAFSTKTLWLTSAFHSDSRFLPLHAKSKKKKSPKSSIIAVNRIAYRNYEVVETIEAGIALKGTEVKSLRDGKLQLRDGFVKATPRSLTMLNVHIGKNHNTGAYFQHEERRPRQLLVHAAQARKLYLQTDKTRGMTIIPLKAYFSDKNFVKIQIGLCRGKNVRDKRADIQARENKREEQRIIKSFRVGM